MKSSSRTTCRVRPWLRVVLATGFALAIGNFAGPAEAQPRIDQSAVEKKGNEPGTAELKSMLLEMKGEIEKLRQKVDSQQRVIEKLSGSPSAAVIPPVPTSNSVSPPASPSAAGATTGFDAEAVAAEVTEKVLEKIQPAIKSAATSTPGQFNPAIGAIVDTAASFKEGGQDDFEFRSAELALSASIDPFSQGWMIFNGTSDEIEVEEAALQTTALPENLKVTGGRFFADFGRLSKVHDHDLPFVNRPQALDQFVDGESQATGVEVNYFAPTSQYLSLTAGAYNKIGAENDRVDNSEDRSLNKFTYLGRAATFFELNDTNSVDLGGSFAYTPEVAEEDDGSRELAGIDLTYRYTPLDQALYRGIVWGTEWLHNAEDRAPGESSDGVIDSTADGAGDENAAPVFSRQNADGVYSYLELKLSRRTMPGFLFDYAEDINGGGSNITTYSPYVSYWISEFQRLRFQYSYVDDDGSTDNQFYIQWTGAMGNHVHGFKDR